MSKKDYIWYDRKHYAWFPFSFTSYWIAKNRLYCKTGLLSTKSDELLLYRITDISLTRTVLQRIFGTGSITIHTRADSSNTINLINVKKSEKVRSLISSLVENARDEKRISGKELYGADINFFEE